MHVTALTDLRPELGERVFLRIGDVAFGATVTDIADDRVTVELVDAELMRGSGMLHGPVQCTETAPRPPGPETTIWAV